MPVSAETGLGLVVWTTDIPALSNLLEQAAGLEVLQRHPGYAELQAGTGRIVLHADDDAFRGHPWFDALRRDGAARGIGAEIRLSVENVDDAYARAIKLGAQAVQQPSDVGDAYECVVMVTDGFLLSLWEPARPIAAAAPAQPAGKRSWPTRPSILRRP